MKDAHMELKLDDQKEITSYEVLNVKTITEMLESDLDSSLDSSNSLAMYRRMLRFEDEEDLLHNWFYNKEGVPS